MQPPPLVFAGAIAFLAGALLSLLAHAADPHGLSGAGAPGRLQLDHGKKWPTDEALRRGMSAINELVHRAPAALHKGTAKTEAYAGLGARIEREVGRIVAKCRLAPDADAQLHLVITDMIAGANAMKGEKLSAEGRGGLARIAGALRTYDSYFDHPGWITAVR